MIEHFDVYTAHATLIDSYDYASVLQTMRGGGGFGTYQVAAAMTAVYPDVGGCLLYPILGLVDEACELAAKAVARLAEVSDLRNPPARLTIGVLTAARYLGELCGHLKKAHRDDNGELTAACRYRVSAALVGVEECIFLIRRDIELSDRVVMLPMILTADVREAMLKEAGDALYYVAQACTELHARLGDVALANNEKLFDRAARGKLHGSGDNR